jgi:predicted nucleic-acid-binding protein
VIGLDTNVLVRFLVEDDDEQTLKATQLIEGAVRAGIPLYVSAVVLCEVIWVLARIYRLTKDELVEIVRSLVQTPELEIEGRDGVRRALEAFVSGKGDFSDYLIREMALGAGCDRIATFDKALLAEPSFFCP